ncbi:CheR family methyltransferase [Methylobacterium sp. ID0610]|uniref:CheR family methyltransferase n=1 Tax=Methylobacterium carpenticola TaxID=3344827 RepID=UPI0036A8A2C3
MTNTSERDDRTADATVFIALGASGGSPRSLERLLCRLPPQSEAAVIVVLQNREALDEAGFGRALGEAGRTLTPITEGSPAERGRIYLADANLIVTLEDGRFHVRTAQERIGERGTIDSFLLSLAANEEARSLAVILGGTAGDGTLGFKAIKEAGGLALAEETEETRAGTLAASVNPAALADAILSIDDLADRIVAHVGTITHRAVGRSVSSTDAEVSASLTAIAAILRNRTGHDFHGYKPGTFVRRVQRRMQVVQTDTVQAYLEILRTKQEEVQQLFNDLLIGVTRFFRDPAEFALLERDVIPKLFAGKGRSDPLRVWVIGCSTGEEAYSIGILLRERMATLDVVPQIQIFATDLDGRALAAARAARYPESIAQDLTPERLARWFVREGNTYCVVKELREMCIFSQHSIVKDAPFSRIDLISCRNLLIYLDAELQNQVVPLLHFALKPQGVLFLGSSESVSRHPKLFTSVGGRSRIFRRLETGVRMLPNFPFATASQLAGSPPAIDIDQRLRAEASLTRRAERFAERYAPAYVIVDASYNVLHFSGRTGRYIDPAGGVASLNLLQLAHPDLRLDLRNALTKAAEEERTIQVENLRIGQNGHSLVIGLVVEPIPEKPGTPHGFFVLFRDGLRLPAEKADAAPSQQHEHTQRLEAELRTTRDRLQATNEELETTNEELKASNEEYQALNEELQAANEELQTSKEELQSINEELTTVNGELGHRVHELARANSDLKNLIESTQIATVFLDNELRVTSFTPAATEIFHLVGSDEGRPIAHIKARVAYDELPEDARRVLRTLSSVEREVSNAATGSFYMARVLPYRSVDNYIAGVVITFIDVTARRRAEAALGESEARHRALIEGVPQLVWRAVGRGHWTWSSPQWSAFTGLSEAESSGLGWLNALHPDDREAALACWQVAETSGEMKMEGRICHAAEQRFRWFTTRAAPVRDEQGRIVEWLGTSTDIDDLRQLQEQQRVMVAELQHRTRNLIAVVRSIARQTSAASPSLEAFGEAFNERLGALSRVQGLLSRSDEERITIGALVRQELGALGADELQAHLSVSGPEVALRNSTVQTLALAIHELATNARKYGALSRAGGRLSVTWTFEEERRLRLDWVEEGITVDGERGSGYGRELIERALPYALGAQTRYELDASSLRCRIDLPLDKRSAEAR